MQRKHREEKEKKLARFCALLKEYNEKFNLTSIKDDDEIYEKHFADSLKGEEFFFENAKVLEVGSGGGFPSVPLKIARDDLDFPVLEAPEKNVYSVKTNGKHCGKKCSYLKTIGKELGFENFAVLNGRAEELGKKEEYREKFDIVTARAVAGLNVLCEYCLPFVKIGGIFVAYKGEAEEEINKAGNAIKVLGGKIETVKDFILSKKSGRRNIIVIKKIAKTPSLYPRGNGKERKNPL